MTVRIGKIAGIPIGIHPLWFVIVGLITWTLAESYFPAEVDGIDPALAYALGFAAALLLFTSIVLHELGHSLVARRAGIEIEEIDLWLLGGVARMAGSAKRAGDELRFALAGPAVSAVIAASLGVVLLLLPTSAPQELRALIAYEAIVNAAILGFNMLPAFPMDGGRVLRSLIWRRSGDLGAATRQAASVGRIFGGGFIGLGAITFAAGAVGGVWLVLVGFFVIFAGRAEEEGQELHELAERGMFELLVSVPAVTIPAGLSADEALRSYFGRYPYHSFPVMAESGEPLGMLSIDRLERVPPALRPGLTAGELADRDPALFADEDASLSELLQRPAFRRSGRAIVRCADGSVGVFSVTALERGLRVERALGPQTRAGERVGSAAAGSR